MFRYSERGNYPQANRSYGMTVTPFQTNPTIQAHATGTQTAFMGRPQELGTSYPAPAYENWSMQGYDPRHTAYYGHVSQAALAFRGHVPQVSFASEPSTHFGLAHNPYANQGATQATSNITAVQPAMRYITPDYRIGESRHHYYTSR